MVLLIFQVFVIKVQYLEFVMATMNRENVLTMEKLETAFRIIDVVSKIYYLF